MPLAARDGITSVLKTYSKSMSFVIRKLSCGKPGPAHA